MIDERIGILMTTLVMFEFDHKYGPDHLLLGMDRPLALPKLANPTFHYVSSQFQFQIKINHNFQI